MAEIRGAKDMHSEGRRCEAHWRIAPHVHVCVTQDGSVLLDLKRDKYLGLGREQTEVLAAAVSGWPSPGWTYVGGRGAAAEEARRLCESMLEDGLLMRDNESTPLAVEGIWVDAAMQIDLKGNLVSVGDELEVRGRLGAAHMANIISAYVAARYSLKWRPLDSTIETARSKKRQGLGSGDPGDIFRLAAMVDVFRRLRPFVFAPEGRCLLHALTLVNYLRNYHLYPEWVIGVRTQPWGAHSWVQWGNFLIDTNPEKVCQYTPILVV